MLIQIAGDYGSPRTDGSPVLDDSLTDGRTGDVHILGNGAKRHDKQASSDSLKHRLATKAPQPREESRGRREGLTVNTEIGRSASTGAVPQPEYERARSPYLFHPPPNSKPNHNRASADCLLSPEPISPRPNGSGGGHQNVQFRRHPVCDTKSRKDSDNNSNRARDGQQRPLRPVRPTMERRASAMPQLGGPAPTSAARSRYVENSSDESDHDKYTKIPSRSGQFTPDTAPIQPSSYFDSLRPSEVDFGPKHQANSPPRTPLSPEHTKGTFFNRETLLNGPALQHLSTLLEGNHLAHTDQRRASPRPSPQPSPRASPTASPYSSPPRTPPEGHYRRSYTVESLRKDVPNSRASSPLSSRQSSPKAIAQTFSQRQMDHKAAPRPSISQSSRTSTSDAATLKRPNVSHGPHVDIRSPSPVPSKNDNASSRDDLMPRYQSGRQTSYQSSTTKAVPSLQPIHPHQRQRSASNATDLRSGLSPLSTNPPAPVQSAGTPTNSRLRSRQESYTPTTPAATLGTDLLESGSSGRSRSTAPGTSSHHRHRSRSRAGSTSELAQRSRSSAPFQVVPASDQTQPVMLPQCPRPEPVAGFDDWQTLDEYPSMAICPDCRRNIFGSGFERAFQHRSESKISQKTFCSLNDPWIRLACLLTFSKQRKDTRLLGHLAEVSMDEPPCPQSRPADDRAWYHLRDSETNQDFQDFQVCSHCVCSLETIYPVLGHMFHRSRDLKKEPRVCSFRSDVHRLGKYLNHLVAMADEAKTTGTKPATSDFIWEVKWMTVISPCKKSALDYGGDWHTHDDLPGFTVCEECYFTVVRPIVKSSRSRLASEITPHATEIIGSASCKLYSPRMKQIFETACRDKDFEYLRKAVVKRNDLQQDLEQAKMELQRTPADRQAKEDAEYLLNKWKKLERRHD